MTAATIIGSEVPLYTLKQGTQIILDGDAFEKLPDDIVLVTRDNGQIPIDGELGTSHNVWPLVEKTTTRLVFQMDLPDITFLDRHYIYGIASPSTPPRRLLLDLNDFPLTQG